MENRPEKRGRRVIATTITALSACAFLVGSLAAGENRQNAAALPNEAPRGAAGVVIAFDGSSSENITNVNASLVLGKNSINQLHINDLAQVMVYSDTANSLLPLSSPPEASAAVDNFLGKILPAGSTDLRGAFGQAEVNLSAMPSGQKALIVKGDGCSSSSLSDTGDALNKLKNAGMVVIYIQDKAASGTHGTCNLASLPFDKFYPLGTNPTAADLSQDLDNLLPNPKIATEIAVNGPLKPGDQLNWNIDVTNTGQLALTSTLTSTASLNPDVFTQKNFGIPLSTTKHFTHTDQIPTDFCGVITSSVEVAAPMQNVGAADTVTVTVECPPKKYDVDISVSTPREVRPGETITTTVTATNTGDLPFVDNAAMPAYFYRPEEGKNASIKDFKEAPEACSKHVTNFYPGDVISYTCPYTLTNDLGIINSEAAFAAMEKNGIDWHEFFRKYSNIEQTQITPRSYRILLPLTLKGYSSVPKMRDLYVNYANLPAQGLRFCIINDGLVSIDPGVRWTVYINPSIPITQANILWRDVAEGGDMGMSAINFQPHETLCFQTWPCAGKSPNCQSSLGGGVIPNPLTPGTKVTIYADSYIDQFPFPSDPMGLVHEDNEANNAANYLVDVSGNLSQIYSRMKSR